MSLLQPLLAYSDWGLVVLRVVAGVIFIVHGTPKLFGPQPGVKGFTAWLRSMNIPLAGLFGIVVPLLEFFGGIALILGFLTQAFALLLAVNMLVATLLKMTKMSKKFSGDGGWEFDLVLIAVMLALALGGSGILSLDGGI
ncbi:MAG: DoxX family protein [bacterium]|nr:DoxX family protein [bacterium]